MNLLDNLDTKNYSDVSGYNITFDGFYIFKILIMLSCYA